MPRHPVLGRRTESLEDGRRLTLSPAHRPNIEAGAGLAGAGGSHRPLGSQGTHDQGAESDHQEGQSQCALAFPCSPAQFLRLGLP